MADLEVKQNGALTVDGIVIGWFQNKKMTLNMGWCRAAEVHVKVEADPEVDRKKTLVDRSPYGGAAVEGGSDQRS